MRAPFLTSSAPRQLHHTVRRLTSHIPGDSHPSKSARHRYNLRQIPPTLPKNRYCLRKKAGCQSHGLPNRDRHQCNQWRLRQYRKPNCHPCGRKKHIELSPPSTCQRRNEFLKQHSVGNQWQLEQERSERNSNVLSLNLYPSLPYKSKWGRTYKK